ncbi:hypothetical protein ABK040_013524 [Willaertia magna]
MKNNRNATTPNTFVFHNLTSASIAAKSRTANKNINNNLEKNNGGRKENWSKTFIPPDYLNNSFNNSKTFNNSPEKSTNFIQTENHFTNISSSVTQPQTFNFHPPISTTTTTAIIEPINKKNTTSLTIMSNNNTQLNNIQMVKPIPIYNSLPRANPVPFVTNSNLQIISTVQQNIVNNSPNNNGSVKRNNNETTNYNFVNNHSSNEPTFKKRKQNENSKIENTVNNNKIPVFENSKKFIEILKGFENNESENNYFCYVYKKHLLKLDKTEFPCIFKLEENENSGFGFSHIQFFQMFAQFVVSEFFKQNISPPPGIISIIQYFNELSTLNILLNEEIKVKLRKEQLIEKQKSNNVDLSQNPSNTVSFPSLSSSITRFNSNENVDTTGVGSSSNCSPNSSTIMNQKSGIKTIIPSDKVVVNSQMLITNNEESEKKDKQIESKLDESSLLSTSPLAITLINNTIIKQEKEEIKTDEKEIKDVSMLNNNDNSEDSEEEDSLFTLRQDRLEDTSLEEKESQKYNKEEEQTKAEPTEIVEYKLEEKIVTQYFNRHENSSNNRSPIVLLEDEEMFTDDIEIPQAYKDNSIIQTNVNSNELSVITDSVGVSGKQVEKQLVVEHSSFKEIEAQNEREQQENIKNDLDKQKERKEEMNSKESNVQEKATELINETIKNEGNKKPNRKKKEKSKVVSKSNEEGKKQKEISTTKRKSSSSTSKLSTVTSKSNKSEKKKKTAIEEENSEKKRKIKGKKNKEEVTSTNNDPYDHSQGIYRVEKLVIKKIRPGKESQYFVKWDGYPDSENTWVNESDILDETLIKNFKGKVITKK